MQYTQTNNLVYMACDGVFSQVYIWSEVDCIFCKLYMNDVSVSARRMMTREHGWMWYFCFSSFDKLFSRNNSRVYTERDACYTQKNETKWYVSIVIVVISVSVVERNVEVRREANGETQTTGRNSRRKVCSKTATSASVVVLCLFTLCNCLRECMLMCEYVRGHNGLTVLWARCRFQSNPQIWIFLSLISSCKRWMKVFRWRWI